MARKRRDDWDIDEPEEQAPPPTCWLCGRPTGATLVWHHPVPKSRGGRETVPMHAICQNTLMTNFTNSQLERIGMDVDQLLAEPVIDKFVKWVAKKDPDFNAAPAKKGR
ncbi:MAG: hypothetical protein B7Y88_00885 [Sphingomonadales bacterium 32-64-17]|nr:MAG: hypothetical protein B7Y88_00885 [Sphingomonadales bacterium 32-64-17]